MEQLNRELRFSSQEGVQQLVLVEFHDQSEPNNGMQGQGQHDCGDEDHYRKELQTPHLQLVDSLPQEDLVVAAENDVKDISDVTEDAVAVGAFTCTRMQVEDGCPTEKNEGVSMSQLSEGMGIGLPTDQLGENLDREGIALELDNKICCNCNCGLDKLEGTNLQGNFSCDIYQATTRNTEKITLRIIDGLKNLYSNDGNMCTCEMEDNNEPFENKNDLYMCSSCVSKFSHLYQLYNDFLSLSTKTNSVIASLLATFSKDRRELKRNKEKSSNCLDKFPNMKRFYKPFQTFKPTDKMTLPKKSSKKKILPKISRQCAIPCNVKTKKSAIINKKFNQSNSHRNKSAHNISKRKNDISPASRDMIQLRTHLKAPPKNHYIQPTKEKMKLSKRISASKSKMTTKQPSLEDMKCDRCDKLFNSVSGLKVHYASHLRDDNKYTCKECGKKFRKKEAMEMHKEIDHKGFKPHKCPHENCDRSFRLKDKLRLHVKVVHEKQKPFTCLKCEKSFRTKYHLKIHDVGQHVQGDNSIGCSQCKRKFSTREALEIHVKTHDEEKPFVCEKCDKGFHTASRLKLHVKSHEIVPSCLCSICGKAYKHVRDLRLHEVIHQDESTYRFSCGDCPKKFYRIDLLRVHQSNEKHFSPELVGPSISKINRPKVKSNKTKEYRVIIPDVLNEFESDDDPADSPPHTFSENPTPISVPKAKKVKPIKIKAFPLNRDRDAQSIHSTTIRPPTMVHLDYPPEQKQDLENELHVGTSYISQRILQDSADPGTLNIHPQVRNGNMATDPNSSSCHLTLPLHPSSATVQMGGNAIYTIRDLNDRNISAFSISAGAEQIGFDVINAFINNLN